MDVLMPFTDLLSTYEEHLNTHLKLLTVILLLKNQTQRNQLGSSIQCHQPCATLFINNEILLVKTP